MVGPCCKLWGAIHQSCICHSVLMQAASLQWRLSCLLFPICQVFHWLPLAVHCCNTVLVVSHTRSPSDCCRATQLACSTDGRVPQLSLLCSGAGPLRGSLCYGRQGSAAGLAQRLCQAPCHAKSKLTGLCSRCLERSIAGRARQLSLCHVRRQFVPQS